MPTPPKSAVHWAVPLLGLAAFAAGIWLVRALGPWEDPGLPGLLLVMVVGVPLTAVELLQRTWQRADSGLGGSHDPSLQRTAVKYLGLLGSLGFVAVGYLVFPLYSDPFYGPYFAMLLKLVPVLLVAALPYFYLVDRRMREPHDGYWQMGQVLLLRWREVDVPQLRQHLLAWLVKGFFLPLMFGYLCQDMGRLLHFDAGMPAESHSLYLLASSGLYFVDVTLATVGYLATLRLADSHIRSTEPTLLGWAVALACYAPFRELVFGSYLDYHGSSDWQDWFAGSPTFYMAWGGVILLLTLVYLWATLAFGCRFSNLTHRGILTNGPYRFSKHPAYLAKNLSWWLIAMPFMAEDGAWPGLLRCLMLLGVNGLYWLRARTEERHLSLDPVYVQYALWMEEHGLLRRVTRLPGLGFLRYRVPEA
jgi:protein-S-isoprenylcysteine O-methyltransferase Ste14